MSKTFRETPFDCSLTNKLTGKCWQKYRERHEFAFQVVPGLPYTSETGISSCLMGHKVRMQSLLIRPDVATEYNFILQYHYFFETVFQKQHNFLKKKKKNGCIWLHSHPLLLLGNLVCCDVFVIHRV